MPVRAGGAPSPPPEYHTVIGRVRFVAADGTESLMKVRMSSGNTAAVVVAYCCAKLNDRFQYALQPPDYALKLTSPRLDAKKNTKKAETDEDEEYLYGRVDILSYNEEVQEAVSRGEELCFDMVIAPRKVRMAKPESVPRKRGPTNPTPVSAPLEPPPHSSSSAPFISPSMYGKLEKAYHEEVEREMRLLDWHRVPTASSAVPILQAAAAAAEERIDREKQALSGMRSRTSMLNPRLSGQMPPGVFSQLAGDTSFSPAPRTSHPGPPSPQQAEGGHEVPSPHALPSTAAEILRRECSELEAELQNTKSTNKALRSRIDDLERDNTALRRDNEQLRDQLAGAEAKASECALAKEEVQHYTIEVATLRGDRERLKKQLEQADDREKKLREEILALQAELTEVAKRPSSPRSIMISLPTPPPPPPLHPMESQREPLVVQATSPARPRRVAASETVSKVNFSVTIDSPLKSLPVLSDDDTLGSIVAKLTGKQSLGDEVDRSLQLKDDDLLHETPSASSSPKPPLGPDSEVSSPWPATPASSTHGGPLSVDAMRQRLMDLAQDLSRLGAADGDRQTILSQIAELRRHLPTPHSAPGSVSGTPYSAGPGSPGGPSRSASGYSNPAHKQLVINSTPAVPPSPPPAPHSVRSTSTVASYHGKGTRPPGLG